MHHAVAGVEQARQHGAYPMIFAHSVEGRSVDEWETLEAHSRRVAKAAARRAEPFGMMPAAEALGLLHDPGAKPAFQKRLGGSQAAVPHSGEGALALSRTGTFGRTLASTIAGPPRTAAKP
jgi:CRISPR-associated endonuclease/helicase Cas3